MRIKKSVIIGVSIIALVIVSAAGVRSFFLHKKFSYSERFSAEVVHPLTIQRDASGVPLVTAGDVRDAWYALGYCQALDRLPVMEYKRAIACGRVDGLRMGADGVKLAGLVRMLDIQGTASSVYSRIDLPHQQILNLFVRGINDAKKRHGASSFLLDAHDRAPWRAEDVLAIAIFDSWTSSFLSSKELQFTIPEKKYFAALDDFIPKAAVSTYKDRYQSYASGLLSLKRLLLKVWGGREDSLFAYLPAKEGEKDFFTFLASKPTSVYPSLMNIVVEISGVRYSCIVRAGSPFPSAVVSDSLRYAAFPLSLDAIDFYLLPVEKKDGISRYYTEFEWKPFSENQPSPGSGSSSFRMTDFGPVISDLDKHEEDSVCVAVDRVLFSEKTAVSLLDAPFAKNAAEAISIASAYDSYPFCFAVNAARHVSVLPAGKTTQHIFKGILFQERNSVPRPADLSGYRREFEGVKVLGTSILSQKEFPLLAESIPDFTNSRFDALSVLLNGDLSRTAFLDAVRDSVSETDFRLSRKFIKHLENIPVTSAKLSRVYLSDWDGSLSDTPRAPLIYHQMLFSFLDAAFSDELGSDASQILDNPQLVAGRLDVILDKSDSRAFDNVATPEDFETLDKVFSLSFLKSMRTLHRNYGPEMSGWSWSRVHQSHFDIPYLSAGFFRSLFLSHEKKDLRYSAEVYFDQERKSFSVRENAKDLILWNDNVYFQSNYSASLLPRSRFFSNTSGEDILDNVSSYKAIYTATVNPVLHQTVLGQ